MTIHSVAVARTPNLSIRCEHSNAELPPPRFPYFFLVLRNDCFIVLSALLKTRFGMDVAYTEENCWVNLCKTFFDAIINKTVSSSGRLRCYRECAS